MASLLLYHKLITREDYDDPTYPRKEIHERVQWLMEHRDTWTQMLSKGDDYDRCAVRDRVREALIEYTRRWSWPWDWQDAWRAVGQSPADDSDLLDQVLARYEDEPHLLRPQVCHFRPDIPKMIELWTLAELDLDKGLQFIREVQRGSHLKPSSLPKFRDEAIVQLCELVGNTIADVKPAVDERPRDGEEAHRSVQTPAIQHLLQDLKQSRDKNEDGRMLRQFLALLMADARIEHEVHRDFIQSIYKRCEKEHRISLQHLVHKYRELEKKSEKQKKKK